MRHRLCVIMLTVSAAGACASAPRTRSFQELPRYLEMGETIQLTEITGVTSSGTLLALSPASLMILMNRDRRNVPESEVAKIQRRQRRVGRGALIGFGVGAGLGWIGARSQEPTGTLIDAHAAGANVLGGVILGTAAGALIGAFVNVNRTVYDAPIPPLAHPQVRADGRE